MGLFDWMAELFGAKKTETVSEAAKGENKFFTVETSEGEFCRINTGDLSSPFYGSAWTKILGAYEKRDFLRARAVARCVSRDNRFSGYSVEVEGVEAFLPASKAAWYYNPERDASGKYIAVGIESVYTSGGKAGKLVVNAFEPVKYLTQRQNWKDYAVGRTPYVMAVDFDDKFLLCPHYREGIIAVPIGEAVNVAARKGITGGREELTGYCWCVRMLEWRGKYGLGSAVEVLSD